MNKLMIIVIFLFIAGLSVVQAFDVGDRVMADWSGTIMQRNGNAIFVQYDDGDEEYTTIAHIRME